MRRLLPSLAGLLLALPAAAQDDPWGLGTSSSGEEQDQDQAPEAPPPPPAVPWTEVPVQPTPAPDPWAPPLDPADPPPAPPTPVMPIGQAPPGAGFSSLERCRAAWQADRGWVQRLVPTWQHPTTERCVYAAGADRWAIAEEPASIVLSAAVDLPLLGAIAGLSTAAALTDPVARGRENWDTSSTSDRAVAGAGAQRRDPLPLRSEPDAVAGIVSDGLAIGATAATLAAPLALPRRNGRLTNLVVLSEAFALNLSVQQLVARRVAEPRPLAFQDMSAWSDDDFATVAEELASPQAWTSFYSGHTSTTATVAYGYATLYTLDAFDSGRGTAGMTLMLYPVAFMLSNLQGQLQVDALRHDPTDVWIGHLAGGVIGTGVPLLHHLVALHGRTRPGAPPDAPAGPRVVVSPMVAPGALGVQGRW